MPQDSAQQPAPSDHSGGSAPGFQRKFEQAIGAWAEATKDKDAEAAQAAAMEVLMLAAEEAERNPSPSLQLQQEADDLEEKCQWAEAERVRRQFLSVVEAEGNHGMIAKAQLDLSYNLRVRGRMQEAIERVIAATESARRTEISTLTAMMLDAWAWCLLEMNRAGQALPLLDEALALTDPDLGGSMRARLWAARAIACARLGNEARAEEDLAACTETVDSMIIGGFPGQILLKSRLLEATAALAASQGNLKTAIESIDRALSWWQQVESTTAQIARARLLSKLADYHRHGGNEEQAQKTDLEAARLRAQLYLETSQTQSATAT